MKNKALIARVAIVVLLIAAPVALLFADGYAQGGADLKFTGVTKTGGDGTVSVVGISADGHQMTIRYHAGGYSGSKNWDGNFNYEEIGQVESVKILTRDNYASGGSGYLTYDYFGETCDATPNAEFAFARAPYIDQITSSGALDGGWFRELDFLDGTSQTGGSHTPIRTCPQHPNSAWDYYATFEIVEINGVNIQVTPTPIPPTPTLYPQCEWEPIAFTPLGYGVENWFPFSYPDYAGVRAKFTVDAAIVTPERTHDCTANEWCIIDVIGGPLQEESDGGWLYCYAEGNACPLSAWEGLKQWFNCDGFLDMPEIEAQPISIARWVEFGLIEQSCFTYNNPGFDLINDIPAPLSVAVDTFGLGIPDWSWQAFTWQVCLDAYGFQTLKIGDIDIYTWANTVITLGALLIVAFMIRR